MKKKPKSSSPSTGLPCFECEAGRLQSVVQNYTTHLPKLGDLTLSSVPMLRCDHCGDTIIGDEGNKKIDAWLNRLTNSISPEEIQSLLTKYRLTQKEASAITGLGEKNISRWLTGRARPSESVSNFLRILLADASVFERVRQKNFSTEPPVVSYPVEIRKPDKGEIAVLKKVDYSRLTNIGVVQKARNYVEKRTELCRWSKSPTLIDFERKMESRMRGLAAFKDTKQSFNEVSGGLWVWLGEEAGRKVETAPYSRDKLHAAVKKLRNLTIGALTKTAPEVQSILANAGVALVFVPIMKESALRGCTYLLTQNKALIIHGLKYRSLSQFWIILFHEIAHLLLHISEPGQSFPDYEEASNDPREIQADEWALDTLVSRDRELEFLANKPKPSHWDLQSYSDQICLHPAIAAEVLNQRNRRQVISYGYLRKNGLFPQLSSEETDALIATSSFVD